MFKVTVEYSTPKLSKTEALLNQLSLAKEITDNLKDETYPIIEAVGKAKYDAIMNQIQPLIAGLKAYIKLTGHPSRNVWCYLKECIHGVSPEVMFSIEVTSCETFVKFRRGSWSYDFDWDKESDRMTQEDGVLSLWNDKAIDTMQNQLNELIESAIVGQEKAQEKIRSRFNQMIENN